MSAYDAILSSAAGTVVAGVTPLVLSDFRNGVYALNGVSKSLGDIWEQNLAWSHFNSANIIPGVGMRAPGGAGTTGDCGPALISSVAETLLPDGFVAVISYNCLPDAGDASCLSSLWVFDEPDFNMYWAWDTGKVTGTRKAVLQDAGGENVIETVSPYGTDGLHKVALLFSPTHLYASVNGLANLTVNSTASVTPTTVGLNVYASSPASLSVVEKIRFFSLSDYGASDLPALSS